MQKQYDEGETLRYRNATIMDNQKQLADGAETIWYWCNIAMQSSKVFSRKIFEINATIFVIHGIF